jgi:hypothetical protein
MFPRFSLLYIVSSKKKLSHQGRKGLPRLWTRNLASALSYTGPDEIYYRNLTENLPVEVGFTKSKGRTLFAKRKIEEGETLFSDSPIVAAPVSVKAAASCEMCLRPLVPTQLILANPESRQAALNDAAQFQEFKSALLQKLRVHRLEETKDGAGRCFCSPRCRENFHSTFSAGPAFVKRVSNDPKIVETVGIKDRSVLDLMIRLLVMTRGWTNPLPGHSARCVLFWSLQLSNTL